MHGGGWILGDAGTHDRLVRELGVGVDAAVVFVEYDRSPEARYPVAIDRATRSRAGSPSTAAWLASTRRGSPSPATRSAAT
jgi:acetyl esterase